MKGLGWPQHYSPGGAAGLGWPRNPQLLEGSSTSGDATLAPCHPAGRQTVVTALRQDTRHVIGAVLSPTRGFTGNVLRRGLRRFRVVRGHPNVGIRRLLIRLALVGHDLGLRHGGLGVGVPPSRRGVRLRGALVLRRPGPDDGRGGRLGFT